MILEYDLRPPLGLREDLKHIGMGLSVVLFQSRDVLRVVRYCALADPSTGFQTKPGLCVVEFLRSRDPMWDDDISIGGVRYSTRSGVKVCVFFPEDGDAKTRVIDLKGVYDKFLNKPRNIDRPQVRALVRNRIRKYLR